jgi:dTDP-4-dehydrorhamnose reductase
VGSEGDAQLPISLVVLGATGMLGHKMFQILRQRFPGVVATSRRSPRKPPFSCVDFLQGNDVIDGVDLNDFGHLQGILTELKPGYIINCVGVIKQRSEAKLMIPSLTINALLPHRLALLAAEWGGRVIHFSTDCVFSGSRGAYTEEDESDAQDLYGKSKFLGEVQGENALTLRTSMIGRELVGHRSLLDWFLAQEGKTIQGFKRTIYSGVTTLELVEVVTLILRNFPTLNGLYQVASDPISKFDLLLLLRKAYNIDIMIQPNESEVSDRSMKGDKFRRVTEYQAPPWADLVERLADDPTPYKQWCINR